MTARDHSTHTEHDAGRYARSAAETDHDTASPGEEDFLSTAQVPCLVCGQPGTKRTDHAKGCRMAEALWGPVTTCSVCGRDGVTGSHTITDRPGSRQCKGMPVAVVR